MTNPCIKAPLSWEGGKLGVKLDDDNLTLSTTAPTGRVTTRPYIHSRGMYNVSITNYAEVGGGFQYSLPGLPAGDTTTLQSGEIGKFQNQDDYHDMLLLIDCHGEMVVRNIIESYISGADNPFFVTSSNSFLIDVRISLPSATSWITVARSTSTVIGPGSGTNPRSNSWYCENRTARILTSRHSELTLEWRLRWAHSSGGYPAGVVFGTYAEAITGASNQMIFIVNGIPLDGWESA